MEINLSTGDFQALEVKAGFYPWITEGSEIKRENDLITGKDAFFYLLDRHPLEPNLGFRQLTFDRNASSFSGKGVTLRVGSQKIESFLLYLERSVKTPSAMVSTEAKEIGWAGTLERKEIGGFPNQYGPGAN